MNAKLPTQQTTSSGAPLPLVGLPQDTLLTVNVEQIPLIKNVFPGIHIQPLRMDPERGEWVIKAIVEPGCSLPIHYHTGTAQVWTIQGCWMYREYPDQPQTAGSYLFEPGGSVHTFYTPETNTEDTITIAWIEGAQVSFNEDGTFHSLNDALSVQYALESLAAARGIAPLPYIRGNSADIAGS
ncbi:2,4'-dihydroxyacetophenone dioxygenase family protein [Pseudomonas sp. PGPR40]|uniref:2,4'-dihydroxyacetophenone dioxygenase family protein n=1 Tax=Pseudomonas sp. PGPR40 TaxID=2913476 RepID=UPI001EDB7E5C|nr:2,4'-dihydroxyacetophenone dioxygenase family protein [Pseudomonas sp. PGPR40]